MGLLHMKKPCVKCMTLRAKFVRWLGITLGVMEPLKEQPKEVQKMEFTPQQALIKIGALALENDVLMGQLRQVAEERDALKAKYEPQEAKTLEVVK